MLADLRRDHPELEQVVLRIGTILGERVDNQITALFERPRLLKVRGAASPFVFVWETDVVAVIEQAVTGSATGVFNVAGDGVMTVDDIAAGLGKPTLSIPEPVLATAARIGRRLGLTTYGPEQTMFLRYRPVLDNTRLKASSATPRRAPAPRRSPSGGLPAPPPPRQRVPTRRSTSSPGAGRPRSRGPGGPACGTRRRRDAAPPG